MFYPLQSLENKKDGEKLLIIENFLRANMEKLEYILTHLDSSNIIEIDTGKTKIHKGE